MPTSEQIAAAIRLKLGEYSFPAKTPSAKDMRTAVNAIKTLAAVIAGDRVVSGGASTSGVCNNVEAKANVRNDFFREEFFAQLKALA